MKFLICVVVCFFSFVFKLASSIHCYDCNSMNNSMCLDPSIYDDESLRKYLQPTPCGHGLYSPDQHGFFCRKIVQTSEYYVESFDSMCLDSGPFDKGTEDHQIFHKGYMPEVRVTRGCGWVRHHRECYKADNEDHLETVCQCFSDGCNTATVAEISAILLPIAAFTVFF